MKNNYQFRGSVTYAYLGTTNKFDKYSLNFFPIDDATRKAVKATGTRCGVKENDKGFFYTFTNLKKPFVIKDGAPFEEILGDGTVVEIELTVEE
jgi:hypothetical protein